MTNRHVKFDEKPEVCYFDKKTLFIDHAKAHRQKDCSEEERPKLERSPSSEPSAATLALQAAKRAAQVAKEAKGLSSLHSDQTETLMRLLSAEDAVRLSESLKTVVHKVKKGQAIVRQGETGTSLYFVAQGSCITANGHVLAAGSFFGEHAFLTALSLEEDRQLALPLFGSITSLLQSIGGIKGPERSIDVLGHTDEAKVFELEFNVAAEILARNDDALYFVRCTSLQRCEQRTASGESQRQHESTSATNETKIQKRTIVL
jgi:CRP-like cAMP-binding protein